MLQRCVPPAVRNHFASMGSVGSMAGWCGLHDLGKASPAFQAKRPDLAESVAEAGLPFGRLVDAAAAPHGRVTLWTLPDLLKDRPRDPGRLGDPRAFKRAPVTPARTRRPS